MPRSEIVTFLLGRDGDVCTYPDCGQIMDVNDPPTIDHSFPQSRARAAGWTEDQIWDFTNLTLMHRKCNTKKGDFLPLPDGTFPVTVREPRVTGPRPEMCQTCQGTRALKSGEVCVDCGRKATLKLIPDYLKVAVRDCDHDDWICNFCWVGIVPRKSALEHLLMGP